MVVIGGFLIGAVLFAQAAGPVHRVLDPFQFEGIVSLKQVFSPGGIDGVPAEAPDLAITTIEGKPCKLQELTGQNRLVVVNFWATWCRPCVEEMPGLEKVHLAYRDKGVAFLGIATKDTAWKVREFLGQHKITYAIAVDDQDEIAGAFGDVKVLPTTIFLDNENRVVKIHKGYLVQRELEKMLRTLLRKG